MKQTLNRVLGREVKSYLDYAKSVIGSVERSIAGNVIIRVGAEAKENLPAEGWHQTEHIVLTPSEATELILAVAEQIQLIKNEA